eukprot:1418105-Karenia_brevis.AAC.1
MDQTYPKVTTDASSLDALSDFADLADDHKHQDEAHEQARIQVVINLFTGVSPKQKRVRLLKKKLRQIRALKQR